MKKLPQILLVTLLVIFAKSEHSFASHAAGGELVYEWLSDSTYRFYFKFYRDCSGAPEPGIVSLCYRNTCTNQSGSFTMSKLSTLPGGASNGEQVTTGCANNKNKCDSAASAIPGYREWWYSRDFTLPSRCANWKFFTIVIVRNPSANLANVGSQPPPFYVEATLNNVVAQGNSSPYFSVKPVPYVCINQQYNYNNGGVDPNNDSLDFEVLTPLTAANCSATSATSIGYQSKSPALSIPSNPFQTNNSFSIAASTGQLSFQPTELGPQTVSVRVNEYRNGVNIGSVMRDIQVQVINCTSTTPTVTTAPTTVSGNATFTNGQVVGCATKPFSFCYDIKSTSSSAVLVVNDNHAASTPGASVTYTNMATDSVRGCFTWTPGATDTGTRVFTVTVKDSSCATGGVPITQTYIVPLYVWAVTKALKDTTICYGDTADLVGVGGTAYVWSVLSGSSNSLSCTFCKSPKAYPLTTTTYVVSSNSSPICNQSTDTVTVTVNNPPTPVISSNSPICIGDTLELFASTVTGATGYDWVGVNGFTSSLQNPKILNTTGAASGIYAVRSIINGCYSSYAQANFYVGDPPDPVANSNSPVCENTPINLTSTGVNGFTVSSFSWTGPAGYTAFVQNPTITSASLSNTGQYIVQANINDCPAVYDTVSVNVLQAPNLPTVTSPVVYCEAATPSPLTASGTNLLWYTTPTGGVGSTTAPTPSTATPGSVNYYVTQTDGNSCESQRALITVVVNAKPSPPTVNAAYYYCQGSTAPPLTANGTNLLWYTSATGGVGSSTAPTPSTATVGNTVYYVSQTDANGCESDRAMITVFILALPSPPSVTSPVSYCEFGPSTPGLGNFANGSNLLWYTTLNGTGSIVPPTVNTSTPHTDTFYVTQTVGICESPMAMIIVNVFAKPAAPTVTTPIDYCQFTPASPLSANGQNILWYTAPTGGIGSSVPPVPSTTTVGTTDFYASQTINGCESDRAPITVNVKTKPQPPNGIDASYCQFATANPLTALGQNLLWYTQPVGGTSSSTGPVPPTNVADTLYYYVSQTVNGCESDRDTVSVIIKPKPQPPVADSVVEYCLDVQATQLTAQGQNLIWYAGPTGGVGTAIAPVPPTNPVGTASYYVSQTVDGCESDRAKIDVVIDTVVTARIVFSKQPVCKDDSVIISHVGVVPDSGTFTWGFDGGVILEGDTSGPYKIAWDTAGIKTITLYANVLNCKATDTQQIEVLPLPEVSFDMISAACIDQNVYLLPDTGLQYAWSYNWLLHDTTYIVDSLSGGYIVRWDSAGQKVVRLQTVSDSGCISPYFYDTIDIHEDPIAKIVADKALYDLCIRNEIRLSAQQFTNLRYEWEPSEFFADNRVADVVGILASSGYIKLHVYDDINCTAVDSIYAGVHICCDIQFPDAFTPNGDGTNDFFRPITGGNHTIKSFVIVNRYGQRVYESNSQRQGWDGKFNGVPQDMGTYFYYIKYTCNDDNASNEVEKKGNVVLIR